MSWYVNKETACSLYNDSARLGGAHLLAKERTNMPALSIIPFILYFMDPSPLSIQVNDTFEFKYDTSGPLTMETDLKTSDLLAHQSALTFTKNLGPSKLPGNNHFQNYLIW